MENDEEIFDAPVERPRMLLGASNSVDNSNMSLPIPKNTTYEGLEKFKEPTKINIRPYNNGSHANVTRHIYMDDKQCMKVVYAPDSDGEHLKTVWRENEVIIDGAIYTYIEIGDLCWLQQDMQSTLPFPNKRAQQKNCPGAQPGQHYGIRGYLYNPDEAQVVVDSIPGGKWRIPTVDDWNNFKSALNNPSSLDLLADGEEGGNDRYKMGFSLCGYVRVSTGGSLQYS